MTLEKHIICKYLSKFYSMNFFINFFKIIYFLWRCNQDFCERIVYRLKLVSFQKNTYIYYNIFKKSIEISISHHPTHHNNNNCSRIIARVLLVNALIRNGEISAFGSIDVSTIIRSWLIAATPAVRTAYRDSEELMPRFVAAVNYLFVNIACTHDARVSFFSSMISEKKSHTWVFQIDLRIRELLLSQTLLIGNSNWKF